MSLFRNLEKKRKSQETNDTQQRISMRRDMTPKERAEEAALYAELKMKQEESKVSGDDKAVWIRRGGRVVNVGNYPKDHPPKRL